MSDVRLTFVDDDRAPTLSIAQTPAGVFAYVLHCDDAFRLGIVPYVSFLRCYDSWLLIFPDGRAYMYRSQRAAFGAAYCAWIDPDVFNTVEKPLNVPVSFEVM